MAGLDAFNGPSPKIGFHKSASQEAVFDLFFIFLLYQVRREVDQHHGIVTEQTVANTIGGNR